MYSGKRDSSILPMLAEFCVVFGFHDEYSALVEHQHRTFRGVDYQVWQPDDSTDAKLYREPARDTGICFNSIRLPESLADFRADIMKREKQGAQISDIFSVLSLDTRSWTCRFRFCLFSVSWC